MLPNNVARYYTTMRQRNRMVSMMNEDGGFEGVCTFFLLTDEEQVRRYHSRPLWSTPTDDPQGTWVYIDTLWALSWTRGLREGIEEAITMAHPQLRWATWYRPTRTVDRRYTCRIREDVTW